MNDKVRKAAEIARKGMSFEIVQKSGFFPTLEVINSFYQCGIDDIASEVSMQWEPFYLNQSEFDELLEVSH